MKIWIASDHGGYERKKEILEYLESKGYTLEDLGTTSTESVDYPDFAFQVGKKIVENPNDLGILICTTGIGMSIACNKVKGIRCAKVSNVEEATLTREHNDANVLALSAKLELEETKKIVDAFINTPFSNEERHLRRIRKIKEYEEAYDN